MASARSTAWRGSTCFSARAASRRSASRCAASSPDKPTSLSATTWTPESIRNAISAAPVVAQDRRDDVAARARQQTAADDPYAQPDDFTAEAGPAWCDPDLGLTDTGARRRAGRQFEAETPLESVDPTADVTPSGDGFGLTSDADQRRVARQFEDSESVFSQGELGTDDIRATDSGFGLRRDPARELAADRIDDQTDESVSESDITLTDTGDGLAPSSSAR